MRYVSPFSFITVNDEQRELSSKDIFLAKRKLLSEFELQGSSTIDVGGTQLTKNDVINLFNQFEKEDAVNYHLIVASDKILVYFLEHHQIEYKEKFSLEKESLSPELIAWISPYFREAFIDCSTEAFRQQDLYTFSTLMANPRYLTYADELEIWEPLHKQLQMLTDQVKNISDTESHLGNEPVIGDFSSAALIAILRKLPEDQFHAQLSEYAFELMRMSVGVFNKMDRNLAVYIIDAGLSLPISEEVRMQLNRKKEEMNGVNEQLNSGRSDGQPASLWAIVRVVLFIVYIIFKVSTCNQGSGYSYNSYNSNDYSSLKNQETIKQVIEQMNVKAEGRNVNANLDSAITSLLHGIQSNSNFFGSAGKKKNITTGIDPFSDIWKSSYFKNNLLKKNTDIKIVNTDNYKQAELPGKYSIFNIANTSSFNAIVIVNRGDSVFSKYISAGNSCNVPLLNDEPANMYVYAGGDYVGSDGKELEIGKGDKKLRMTLPGLIDNLSIENINLMVTPVTVKAIKSSSLLKIEDKEYGVASATFILDPELGEKFRIVQ